MMMMMMMMETTQRARILWTLMNLTLIPIILMSLRSLLLPLCKQTFSLHLSPQ